jgi:predicted Rossmann fold flavoprotein
MYDLVVIGGGAAGFFGALSANQVNGKARILICEKTAVPLAKVRVSGGGRCNVTHACFDPKLLVAHYPRGSKELVGPFHRFQPQDVFRWFESRGVSLKIEKDGRSFPVTDSSETIIDCFMSEIKKLGIELWLRQKIDRIEKIEGRFLIHTKDQVIETQNILLATGSSKEGYRWAELFGHSIREPVPSLFTFNVPTSPLLELSGITFQKVTLSLDGFPLSQTGPLLITHFGFSGPSALKLSAWSARYLYEKNYCVDLKINWLPDFSVSDIYNTLEEVKKKGPSLTLASQNPFRFPKHFWKIFLGAFAEKRLNDLSLKDLKLLSEKLHGDIYQVNGKTTNKEEFVTCGGISLNEVHFNTMESKLCSGLFFAGEILDIDGITGGFNFQNAWTTGFIAGSSSIATSPKDQKQSI